MKTYIVCGTNYSGEPEEFDVFTDYKEANLFAIQKNSNKKPNGIHYEVFEGELHSKTGFF